MVSHDINTVLQAKLKFENDLNVEIDKDSIVIEKMNQFEIKDWAMQTTNTTVFNEMPFNQKMQFLKQYGI